MKESWRAPSLDFELDSKEMVGDTTFKLDHPCTLPLAHPMFSLVRWCMHVWVGFCFRERKFAAKFPVFTVNQCFILLAFLPFHAAEGS